MEFHIGKKKLVISQSLASQCNDNDILFIRKICTYKIIWNDYKIYFPMENGDLSVIYENQRVAKIKFRRLSIQYKDGIQYIAEEILGNVEDSKVRRAMKLIERGV